MFNVKLKTSAFMIREKEADRPAHAGLASVQVSIYSHRPEVHAAPAMMDGDRSVLNRPTSNI